MYRTRFVYLLISVVTFGAIVFATTPTFAVPVNLNVWTAESYPAVSGFGAGVWTVSPDGDSVYQSVNGQPTLFYSDFNAFNTDVTGTIRVTDSNDDDYIGFALGFQPGDTTNASASYLLVDWKRGNQYYDFGSPSNTPGTTALAGLAVSQVTGIPTADEFWGHTDFGRDPSGGLNELARGNTLGNSGWEANTDYDFRFVFQPTNLQVFVNDILEINIVGSFSDGRLAFYNFSQAEVTYSAFEVDPAPVPEPGTLLLLGTGFIGLVGSRKKFKVKTS